jgi:hypothetical protein
MVWCGVGLTYLLCLNDPLLRDDLAGSPRVRRGDVNEEDTTERARAEHPVLLKVEQRLQREYHTTENEYTWMDDIRHAHQ